MRQTLRWTILIASIVPMVVSVPVSPAHAQQRPNTKKAVVAYLEESNALARQALEMLATSVEKAQILKTRDVNIQAYLKLNAAVARCHVIQEHQKFKDPLLDRVVKNIEEARENMRGATSHMLEATGVGSTESMRAERLRLAGQLIRRSIGLNEQAAAFL
jgi:hypothetical protein